MSRNIPVSTSLEHVLGQVTGHINLTPPRHAEKPTAKTLPLPTDETELRRLSNRNPIGNAANL